MSDEKEFTYRKNNWGYRGRDFSLPLKDGKGVVNMHQSVSGTLYFVDNKGTLRKVTKDILDKLAATTPTHETLLDELKTHLKV